MNAMDGAPSAPPGLYQRRCARHPAREAAARCPSCHEFFCRECVVEHEGKLLCASCLGRSVVAGGRRREKLAALRRTVEATAGVIVLWLTFYGLGALLLKVPAAVHEGTVWQKLDAEPPP
jgi:hypothetical protein